MAASPQYAYQEDVVAFAPPEQAERLMGTYLTCQGIHLPPDPPPRILQGDARSFWDWERGEAKRIYKKDDLAQKSAWKALRLFFRDQYGTPLNPPAVLAPGYGPVTSVGSGFGDLIELGRAVEYTFIDGNAKIERKAFGASVPGAWTMPAPVFYWSPKMRSLIILPHQKQTVCFRPDLSSVGAQGVKIWTQRKAKCRYPVTIPSGEPAQLIGQADALVYRSDKWHDRNPDPQMAGSQEYIHQFGDGVGLWATAGSPPKAIIITGGCLDVEPRGIIH